MNRPHRMTEEEFERLPVGEWQDVKKVLPPLWRPVLNVDAHDNYHVRQETIDREDCPPFCITENNAAYWPPIAWAKFTPYTKKEGPHNGHGKK